MLSAPENMFRSATETETKPGIGISQSTETDDDLSPLWEVLVFNDPVNLMSFVTLIIRRIFGYSQQKATEMMLDVHNKGRAIVWTGEREKAELYVQHLQSHQLLASMRKCEA